MYSTGRSLRLAKQCVYCLFDCLERHLWGGAGADAELVIGEPGAVVQNHMLGLGVQVCGCCLHCL